MKSVLRLVEMIVLLPGNTIAVLLGAAGTHDRCMIRPMIDMLVWNGAFIVCAVVFVL